jgi:hypothetical protein
MNLQSLAISAVIITVTIGIGLAMMAQFSTTIDTLTGGTSDSAAYNASETGIAALATLPDWLSLIILAGAGTAVLGFFLGGIGGRE